ncbi:C40 family peptidase [Niabella aquatica]
MNSINYAIVTVPAAPVRKTPDHHKEMSNQLLFGETVKVLQQKEDWYKVESLYDTYRGWLTSSLITEVDAADALPHCHLLAPQLLNEIFFNGATMHIPAAASLVHYQNGKGTIAGRAYHFKGMPVNTASIPDKRETLIANALQWLNAPYLWGGKTILGVDCSGFSQTMYKLAGVPIARDARLQAQQGTLIRSLKKVIPGDLAFFDDKDEIVHVGILAGSGEIIHAAGKVRKDVIDNKGIINTDTGKRTHSLKLIKRLL